MRKSPINRLASRLFSDACQETIPLNGRACPEEKKFPKKKTGQIEVAFRMKLWPSFCLPNPLGFLDDIPKQSPIQSIPWPPQTKPICSTSPQIAR
ncbi:hypothetical protein RBWH47_02353 [Rhodopirellula baltica WH47]|uniref:Uncharacterized protein n=1 Tax=Rhodopirellula baltica WH47 TaxID=991778 RepID=F2APD7_RHOBT|nr:hypothetical protein RBWH47_02353 [Rhodopirellula baltica WH47]